MDDPRRLLRRLSIFVIAASVVISSAHGTTISWTDWASATSGSISPGISVSYSGQNRGLLINSPSWNPSASFSGGTVDNKPPQASNSVGLTGGSSSVNTVTFSSPVVNPVFAIWSLGRPGFQAQFVFTASEPFAIQAGGPNAEFGGSSITQVGNTINGSEGNGVIQFSGTFSEISWTNPVFENYYAFTVGTEGAGTVVPEPLSFALLGIGLAGIGGFRRYRLTKG